MNHSRLATTAHATDERAVGQTRCTVVLVRDRLDPERLIPCRSGPGVRALARVGAWTLDRRLASGRSPESGRLLAARAEQLVAQPARRALAGQWANLLVQARRHPTLRDHKAHLCRDRIIGAEPDVRVMLEALVRPAPVPARGIALAALLLGDGTGPLYNRHTSADLHRVLWNVTKALDPASGLSALG
jgi:hypothetical protein